MHARPTCAIKYVADMDAAVAVYRDKLGLTARIASMPAGEFDRWTYSAARASGAPAV